MRSPSDQWNQLVALLVNITMTNQHPITPPLELVKQWLTEFYGPESMPGMAPGEMVLHVATVAARWGADQELKACCEWVAYELRHKTLGQSLQWADDLRAARRPKPKSLAEEALKALDGAVLGGDCITISRTLSTIRAALERLQELEKNNG